MQHHVGGRRARTNFAEYSHGELVRMLHAGDPRTVVAAAQTWDAAGAALHERAGDLEHQLRDFEQWWDGGAARQYQTMITELNAGIRQVANTLYAVRDLTYATGEALEQAQRAMPTAVDVPALPPATIAAATTPLTVPADTPRTTVDALRTQQAAAVARVRAHQQVQAAADSAHQQAVQVMTTLAGQYVTVEDSMPLAPVAASPPLTAPPGEQQDTVLPVLPPAPDPLDPYAPQPLPLDPNQPVPAPTTPPLFGSMFTAGLAAASAALGGRFTSWLRPRSGQQRNGQPRPGTTAPGTQPPGSAVSVPPEIGGAGGGAGGIGGIGGGGGGFGGGGADLDKPAPVANSSIAGAAASPAASGLAGAAGAAGAAAAGAGMRGMAGAMPFMPYAPMMAGMDGMDGGRRIPPWLVETEDVWGEQSMVTPAVIGEDTEPDQNQAGRPWGR